MIKLKTHLIWGLTASILACSPASKLNKSDNEKWQPEYRVHLGTNHGGITENTDFSEAENIEADAFTGATKLGINAGAHALLLVFKNNFETGIDYMLSNQTFTYNDLSNNYIGDREIKTSQFMLPITYNMGIYRKQYSEGLFQFKIGYLFQFNLFNVNDSNSDLPSYSTNSFSRGLTIGIATTPFKLKNGASVGFYFDGYRGSKIYDDLYNSDSFEMPGSSFFKGGLIYHFKMR